MPLNINNKKPKIGNLFCILCALTLSLIDVKIFSFSTLILFFKHIFPHLFSYAIFVQCIHHTLSMQCWIFFIFILYFAFCKKKKNHTQNTLEGNSIIMKSHPMHITFQLTINLLCATVFFYYFATALFNSLICVALCLSYRKRKQIHFHFDKSIS